MRVAFGQSTAPIAIGFAVSFSLSPPLSLSFSLFLLQWRQMKNGFEIFHCLPQIAFTVSSHPRDEDDFFLPSDLSPTLPTIDFFRHWKYYTATGRKFLRMN